MKAAVYHCKHDLRLEEWKTPNIKERDVLLEIKAASICGTDVHTYHGELPPDRTPIVLGHEYSGLIQEVGDKITSLKTGDRVIGSPIVPCGECYYCKRGMFRLCLFRQSFGIHLDGALAEYMRVPNAEEVLYLLQEEISFDEGCLVGGFLHGRPRRGKGRRLRG